MFKRHNPVNDCAHGLLRKSAIVASGQAVGYGVALLASPILSRLYSPRDFGHLAIFVALISIMGTIATLRYDNAIPLPKDECSAELLARLATWFVFFTAILLAIAAAFFGDVLDRTIFRSDAAPFTGLLSAAVATFALCEIRSARLIRAGRFAELSKGRMVLAITCVAAQLSVPALWVAGPLGLLLGQIAGYAGELVYAQFTKRGDRAVRPRTDVRELRRIARKYGKYPLFDVSSTLLRILAVHGQALAIVWLYGPAAAGCLVLAQRLLSTPLSMVSFSISRVYYSEAAALKRESPEKLRHLFASTLKRLSLFCVPPLVPACVLAPWTFATIFGSDWKTAGIYCSLLCPLILLRTLAFVVGPTLDVIHRQGLRLVRELTSVVLIAIGAIFSHWLGWSELTAVVITTALGCLGSAIAISLTWHALLAHDSDSATIGVLVRPSQAA